MRDLQKHIAQYKKYQSTFFFFSHIMLHTLYTMRVPLEQL
uniref:Uncharacterized protein n=1 Tax=Ciona intestinalis TaxID=7719 RepID=H2XNW5_CIOIN